MACMDAVKLIESLRKGTLVEYLSNISTELCNHIGGTKTNRAIKLDYMTSGNSGRISKLSIKNIPEGRYIAKSMSCYRNYDMLFTYDNGVYQFRDPFYIELIIGLFVSMLIDGYNNIMCKNFVKIYTYTVCSDICYIFMGMENMTFLEYLKTRKYMLEEHEIDYYVFQILFAIVSYRKAFDIVHGDLHLNNVLLKKQEYEIDTYYKYTLNGKEYYLPADRYIVKIGDWGLSDKFSKPAIVGIYPIDEVDENEKDKCRVTYDIVRLFIDLNIAFGKKSQRIARLTRYLLRLDDIENIDLAAYIETPKCKLVRSPKHVLGDMFDMYTTLPPTGSNIIVMGYI